MTDSPSGTLQKATAALQQGDHQTALDEALQAVKGDAKSVDAWMALGQAQTANHHHRGALAAFRKAIQLEQSPGPRMERLKQLEAEADEILQKTQFEKGG
ncbi:hypothetical protein WJX74_007676 [Apatococcus lobatus]|uniref:Tetratricopeptide repeat protein n=1 Tax=Apatococcus lobatus TaxID=904363 RepID=A0AAW1SG92_9CHLO